VSKYTSEPYTKKFSIGQIIDNLPGRGTTKRPGYTFLGWYKTFPGFYQPISIYPYKQQRKLSDRDVWEWNRDVTFTARW
jgi:hypothetical protein